ncbi:MAG TPA: tetratricopeptide repeat-containing protein [Pyrinomonadaceae bacterium]|jgi:hypothetical protein
MRAFIIRPFGTKNDIDFDEVERALIAPALDALEVTGRTTMEIRRQGNIRLDMFQRLLTADLVVADISIHNANVYYELGVRHALRGKRTFLLRARGAGIKTDEVPFDLKTDRYLTYDGAAPAEGLAELTEGLRQTINSEGRDSPVFQLLPELEEQERAHFLPIPLGFREEVERAAEAGELGDLELLADEARGFEWETEGLRLVGRAQYSLKTFDGARLTWEAVRDLDPTDLEANTLLGTIYQRLGELARSDQALKRALGRKGAGEHDRAELQSLAGRNAKSRWRDDWEQAPEAQRLQRALTSRHLEDSYEAYVRGFNEDLNHFYSGLNALAMLTVKVGLAEALPGVWEDEFDSDEEARAELAKRKDEIKRLSAAVEMSLDAAGLRLKREGRRDTWTEIGEADLCLLTSERPRRVAAAYERALPGGTPALAFDSVRGQLLLYQRLGVRAENVAAALEAVGRIAPAPAGGAEEAGAARRVLLFTGHMIDAPGRDQPRFPADKADVAKRRLAEAVAAEREAAGGVAYGVAGCASGGDMLFHQVCEEAGIPTRVFLALPRDEYVKASVAHAGPLWVEEFNRLVRSHTVRVLGESKALPGWLQEKPGYNVWQRNNLWILHNALAHAGGGNVTLIALWDTEAGDGKGGTFDMIGRASERGAKTVIIDTRSLFGL